MRLKSYLQRKLIRFLIKDIYNIVSKEDFLQVQGGNVLYKNKALNKETILKLKSDAKFLQDMDLLKLVLNDLEYHFQQAIWTRSQSVDDILGAKIGLYFVQEFRGKLKDIENL